MENSSIDYKYEPKECEYRACRKCNFETLENFIKCPNCGIKLDSESKIRSQGPIAVALGGVLLVLTSFLTIGVSALLIWAKVSGSLAEKASSEDEVFFVMLAMYFLFFSLLGVSVTMIFAGRYEIENGRRDRRKVKIALRILYGAFVFMSIIMVFFP